MKAINKVPNVLLEAKKKASNAPAVSHTSGPWDQGHWANR